MPLIKLINQIYVSQRAPCWTFFAHANTFVILPPSPSLLDRSPRTHSCCQPTVVSTKLILVPFAQQFENLILLRVSFYASLFNLFTLCTNNSTQSLGHFTFTFFSFLFFFVPWDALDSNYFHHVNPVFSFFIIRSDLFNTLRLRTRSIVHCLLHA